MPMLALRDLMLVLPGQQKAGKVHKDKRYERIVISRNKTRAWESKPCQVGEWVDRLWNAPG